MGTLASSTGTNFPWKYAHTPDPMPVLPLDDYRAIIMTPTLEHNTAAIGRRCMANREEGGARPTSTVERLGQLALLLLFLFALSGGVALLVQQGRPNGVEITPPPIEVYVTGAVATPGVHTLEEGDRLQDAVDRAGGATDNADLARVNLALRLQDQDHHHIPAEGEEVAIAPSSQADDTSPREDAPAKTNLNTAGMAELMALPGIGEVRARAIIEYRQDVRLFQSVAELVDVSGIGWITVEGLRPLVTVE